MEAISWAEAGAGATALPSVLPLPPPLDPGLSLHNLPPSPFRFPFLADVCVVCLSCALRTLGSRGELKGAGAASRHGWIEAP